ncbi:two-component system, OmpR family, KDP operon response regulator KdpE [Dehalogenimonas formicexedens]|uniref:Two-component system, OmpR family, KDP operon response regulator KdpE n=1 Tax=Dehalogenimonas formicexedens TaxID=1839801 RepID=A0A1P8F9V6_9CHLR|nr:response regulator transcription factor [Dehalogenimonas formicexedens]APV45249.1 two-component system, OmpR family, KDP operon response regulator KdpE [Dehalogenimonas formicexedens]
MDLLVVAPKQEDTDSPAAIFKMLWPGTNVVTSTSSQEALSIVEKRHPDFMLLNIASPSGAWLDLIRDIRLFSAVPLVVVSNDANESTMVRSFELGADDYFVKPYKPLELVLRTKAIIKRANGSNEGESLVVGLLRLHALLHRVYVGDKEVSLTPTENNILRHMMENVGHIVTYSSLAQQVWGDDYPDASATLKVYIKRLRQKLGDDCKRPSMILNETGLGYRLVKPIQS